MNGSRAVRAWILTLLGYAITRTLWIWMPEMVRTPMTASAPVEHRDAVDTMIVSHQTKLFPGAGRGLEETLPPRPRPTPGNASAMHVKTAIPGLPHSRTQPLATTATIPAAPLRRQGSSSTYRSGPLPAQGYATISIDTPPHSAQETLPPRLTAIATPPRSDKPRWSGYTYLYHRADGQTIDPLAPTGQIGGSQAAARIAYRLDEAGHLAIATRATTALRDPRQSETAIGLDLLPAAGLRIGIERRIATGSQGRNAWSAYAAAGLFRALTPRIVMDGYAQAGLVGARRRDPFVDGALRIAHRTPVARHADLHLGAGVWGAAQPGATRIDLGPRVALAVRTQRLPVTLAVEGRVRISGRARPGNGLALTLASDF